MKAERTNERDTMREGRLLLLAEACAVWWCLDGGNSCAAFGGRREFNDGDGRCRLVAWRRRDRAAGRAAERWWWVLEGLFRIFFGKADR